MRRLKLATDVDEVLGDFQSPALDVMERVTGKRWHPEDFEVWDIFSVLSDDERTAVFAEIEQPGWCSAIKPKEGAIEAVAVLRTFCDIFPVTSPFHSPTWMYERTQWLGKLFDWKPREIVHTGSKHHVVADGLLDDNPLHVIDWDLAHPGGLAMLWHIPNTRLMHELDDRRVRSWDELIARVRALAGRKSAYDLLKEREFSRKPFHTTVGDGEQIVCDECRASSYPPKVPDHAPGCRLAEILRHTT